MSQHVNIFASATQLRSIKHSGRLKHRVIQLGYLARYWRAHSQYLDKLKTFQSSAVGRTNTLVDYKYIGNYLALSKTREWRRDVILSNYQIISDIETATANPAIFARPTLLWRLPADGSNPEQRIIFQPTTIAPLEGEFELQFMFGDKLLATLTFVFASGNLVEIEDRAVCLIGSLQGGHDCRAETRQAAKSNGEISPFTMLVLLLRGMTQAIGIETVFGVSTSDQVALRGEHRIGLDYDAMWAREGANLHSNGFYLIEPQSSKPLEQISQSHRKRARQKRERKAQVVAAAKQAFLSMLAPADGAQE